MEFLIVPLVAYRQTETQSTFMFKGFKVTDKQGRQLKGKELCEFVQKVKRVLPTKHIVDVCVVDGILRFDYAHPGQSVIWLKGLADLCFSLEQFCGIMVKVNIQRDYITSQLMQCGLPIDYTLLTKFFFTMSMFNVALKRHIYGDNVYYQSQFYNAMLSSTNTNALYIKFDEPLMQVQNEQE